MNQDVFAGKWKQLKGRAREWWGQLTDDEIDQVQGNAERLAGLLQERYGYSREEAEREIERRMAA
ncbi:MAG TPA: CsbD family protein [Candidatus Binatia bacterium]|nr:CsbD family protein [Candidatus Binatia bacterium]